MTPRPKALISWSSGKDSAFALQEVRRSGAVEVVGALTTVSESRVAIHQVREAILHAQLDAAGLPSVVVPIPSPCPNAVYEARLSDALARAKADGITHIVFGDLFLEDIRAYRESLMQSVGITPLFPLWRRPTAQLARDMIASGLEAYLVAVDLKTLPAAFAGRRFDARLLEDLPEGVDPCGENGEFHTCVAGGPVFSRALPLATGERIERNGFAYCDLLLDEASRTLAG